MTRAFVALGSNLGDRVAALQRAIDGLARTAGVTVLAASRVYETVPVGGPSDSGPYLNAVVAVETTLQPRELLGVAQRLEHEAQRVRTEHWGPRTLDVDLLLFGDVRVDDPDLTIPHPRMWERGFVLAPLRDVAPALVPASESWEGVRLTAVGLTVRTGDPDPAGRHGAHDDEARSGGDGLA